MVLPRNAAMARVLACSTAAVVVMLIGAALLVPLHAEQQQSTSSLRIAVTVAPMVSSSAAPAAPQRSTGDVQVPAPSIADRRVKQSKDSSWRSERLSNSSVTLGSELESGSAVLQTTTVVPK